MIQFTPRFLRMRDAPAYLGMDRNRFNREVRPYIPTIPMGVQGIAFDREDLDAWADHYKKRWQMPAQKDLHLANQAMALEVKAVAPQSPARQARSPAVSHAQAIAYLQSLTSAKKKPKHTRRRSAKPRPKK